MRISSIMIMSVISLITFTSVGAMERPVRSETHPANAKLIMAARTGKVAEIENAIREGGDIFTPINTITNHPFTGQPVTPLLVGNILGVAIMFSDSLHDKDYQEKIWIILKSMIEKDRKRAKEVIKSVLDTLALVVGNFEHANPRQRAAQERLLCVLLALQEEDQQAAQQVDSKNTEAPERTLEVREDIVARLLHTPWQKLAYGSHYLVVPGKS